jgi:hypothetical protein
MEVGVVIGPGPEEGSSPPIVVPVGVVAVGSGEGSSPPMLIGVVTGKGDEELLLMGSGAAIVVFDAAEPLHACG